MQSRAILYYIASALTYPGRDQTTDMPAHSGLSASIKGHEFALGPFGSAIADYVYLYNLNLVLETHDV